MLQKCYTNKQKTPKYKMKCLKLAQNCDSQYNAYVGIVLHEICFQTFGHGCKSVYQVTQGHLRSCIKSRKKFDVEQTT